MERKESMSDQGPEFNQNPSNPAERSGDNGELESLRNRTTEAEARARAAEEAARTATATVNLARDQMNQLSNQNTELMRRLGESDAEKAELARRMEQQLQAERVARREETEETTQRFEDLLAAERQRMAAEIAHFGEARRGERLFPEDIRNTDLLWETFENALLIEEGTGKTFDENKANTLVRAIQLELSSNPELQAAMFGMLRARYSYKNLSHLMAIGAVEPYADLVVQMEAMDHKTILSLPGEKKTIEILENDPTFWRKGGGITLEHKQKVVQGIIEDQGGLTEHMKGYQRRFKNDLSNFSQNEVVLLLENMDDLLDPEKRQKIDWFQGWNDQKQQVAERLLKQVKRNITLATTANNLVGNSVRHDGLVYKKEYGGGYVELKEVFLDVPKALGGGRINLAKLFTEATTEKEKKEKAELKSKIDEVREYQGYLIPMAWDRAMREFYIKNWDKLDFNASLAGKAAGIVKSRFHNPIRYEQSNEKYPGAPGTEPLKKATYVGALPLMFISMRGSVTEQLLEWGGDVKSRLDASGRIKGGEKVRKMFNEEGPKFLYNAEAIGNFDQSLKDFKEAMGYLPGEEQREQMAYMIEPIAKFSMDNLKKVFKYENQNAFAVANRLRLCRERGYINPKQEEEVKREALIRNPLIEKIPGLRNVSETINTIIRRTPGLRNIVMGVKIAFGGSLKSAAALWEMIKLFFQTSFSQK